MGKWYDTKIKIENTDKYKIYPNTAHPKISSLIKQKCVTEKIILLNKHNLRNILSINVYSRYLAKNADAFNDKYFLYSQGDKIHTDINLPIICKVTDLAHSHIITKLNDKRHWGLIPAVKQNDIAFNLKKNSIVWRGVTTGYNKRNPVVERFYSHPIFDIGFNQCVQGETPAMPIKDKLNMKQQLAYKFILSIEGNDVASGLKWQLYSNSVVIMAKPTCVSWAMEDTLVPYVHYIPVKDDYSDLEEMFYWGLAHEAECIAISKAANAFIEQFLNDKKEHRIHRHIIKRYIQNVTLG